MGGAGERPALGRSGNFFAIEKEIVADGIFKAGAGDFRGRGTDDGCRNAIRLEHLGDGVVNPTVGIGHGQAEERRAGRSLTELWYFDLFRGVKALAQYHQWLEGYHDLGLRHLRPADVGARLRTFLRRALDDHSR